MISHPNFVPHPVSTLSGLRLPSPALDRRWWSDALFIIAITFVPRLWSIITWMKSCKGLNVFDLCGTIQGEVSHHSTSFMLKALTTWLMKSDILGHFSLAVQTTAIIRAVILLFHLFPFLTRLPVLAPGCASPTWSCLGITEHGYWARRAWLSSILLLWTAVNCHFWRYIGISFESQMQDVLCK